MQNIPPIWPVQGKVWGTTQCLFSSDTTALHRIKIKKGGFCSEHEHSFKWNRFIVLSGKLLVKIFNDKEEKDLIDQTELTDGMVTDVHPKFYHIFEALTDVDALEVYWVSLDPDDIVRRTTGGLK